MKINDTNILYNSILNSRQRVLEILVGEYSVCVKQSSLPVIRGEIKMVLQSLWIPSFLTKIKSSWSVTARNRGGSSHLPVVYLFPRRTFPIPPLLALSHSLTLSLSSSDRPTGGRRDVESKQKRVGRGSGRQSESRQSGVAWCRTQVVYALVHIERGTHTDATVSSFTRRGFPSFPVSFDRSKGGTALWRLGRRDVMDDT